MFFLYSDGFLGILGEIEKLFDDTISLSFELVHNSQLSKIYLLFLNSDALFKHWWHFVSDVLLISFFF